MGVIKAYVRFERIYSANKAVSYVVQNGYTAFTTNIPRNCHLDR